MRTYRQMKNNHLQIIYIASNGRSGSTILELLLNTFKEVYTLGEVNVIPWELKEEKGLCGCGQEPGKCNFWQSIAERLIDTLSTEGEINKFREFHGGGHLIRIKEIVQILSKKAPETKELDRFCKENLKFFLTIKGFLEKKHGIKVKYIVDSSKDFYRLNYLINCSKINLKIIHLVKNPCAFVYSMVKNEKGFPFIKVLRMSFRYLVENFFIDKVSRDKDVCFLRYEELASCPNTTMVKLADWLGVNYQEGNYKNFRNIENHGLAGNKSRTRKDKIYLDDAWKKNLNSVYKRVVKIITYIPGKKYGYF